jgi:hypothetical protein
MAFEKGHSGNPGGRPLGAANKTTAKLRESISDFLGEQFIKVKDDFTKLKPRDRVRLYIELLQYSVPKMQAVQLETEFDRLSDDQLQELADRLFKKIKTNGTDQQ